ncbi:MAG: response regulator transcription factor [Cyclobacteriaceae bacterium]|nr:response regulator transcription factor [Cyclobacteriaceae bacterium]
MNSIHCIIVDDEPLSQEVIRDFVREVPWLELKGLCFNALEALEMIHETEVDLIFLDINMPKLSGIKFVKSLEKSPMIIFTTAYPEYAVEGFEVDAVDYLVKPVAFERFLKAVNKAREQFEMKQSPGLTHRPGFIVLKSDKKIYKIEENDILYIQSWGDYIKVFTSGKVIIATETMKNLENRMGEQFIRIHKSFIVSTRAINFIEGNQVKIGDQFLPIGLTYKDDLITKLKQGDKKS